jgi:hypothetical protein
VFVRADAANDDVVGLRPDGRVQWRRGVTTFPAHDQVFRRCPRGIGVGCGLEADRKVHCSGSSSYPEE